MIVKKSWKPQHEHESTTKHLVEKCVKPPQVPNETNEKNNLNREMQCTIVRGSHVDGITYIRCETNVGTAFIPKQT